MRGAKLALFFASRYAMGYRVDAEPTLDPAAKTFFQNAASRSKVYLEFGSGGSTVFASRFATILITVESDPRFLRAVQRATGERDLPGFHFLQPKIGLTREWGIPLFRTRTPERVARWKRYPLAPWPVLTEHRAEPDLVLIDGRFRVACALETFLRVSPSCVVLIDDYAVRPHYRIVEQFGELISMHGNMAEFRKLREMNVDACRQFLDVAYTDFR